MRMYRQRKHGLKAVHFLAHGTSKVKKSKLEISWGCKYLFFGSTHFLSGDNWLKTEVYGSQPVNQWISAWSWLLMMHQIIVYLMIIVLKWWFLDFICLSLHTIFKTNGLILLLFNVSQAISFCILNSSSFFLKCDSFSHYQFIPIKQISELPSIGRHI